MRVDCSESSNAVAGYGSLAARDVLVPAKGFAVAAHLAPASLKEDVWKARAEARLA